jgi:hypothetical protein
VESVDSVLNSSMTDVRVSMHDIELLPKIISSVTLARCGYGTHQSKSIMRLLDMLSLKHSVL